MLSAYNRVAAAINSVWNRVFGVPESAVSPARSVRDFDAALAEEAARIRQANARDIERLTQRMKVRAVREARRGRRLTFSQGGVNGGPTAMDTPLRQTVCRLRDNQDAVWGFIMEHAPNEGLALVQSVCEYHDQRVRALGESNIENILNESGQIKQLVVSEMLAASSVLGVVDTLDRIKMRKAGEA